MTNSAYTSEINLEGQGRLKKCGTSEITLKETLSGPMGDRQTDLSLPVIGGSKLECTETSDLI